MSNPERVPAPGSQEASGHRIVEVTTHCLRLPYHGEVQFAQMRQASAEYCLLAIRLDDGTEGVAEAVCRPEFSGEDARAVAYQIATFFQPMVVGADPLHHLTILARLERIRDCRAAKSLIDLALWDLRGKLFGQPVWRLLGGGPAQPVPLTWVAHGNTLEAQREESRRMVFDRGYRGLKLKTWRRSAEDVDLVREVRAAVGAELPIYVDANSKYSEPEAKTILARLAEFRIDFIEDPCRIADLTRMAQLAQALPIALLGDLWCNSLLTVQAHLDARAVGGISVKLRRTGITESLKIIALCEAAGVPMVIGTDSESRIGALPRAHLRTAIPSLAGAPVETHFFDKLATDVFAGDFGFADGALTPSDAPGFGADVDWRAVEKFAF